MTKNARRKHRKNKPPRQTICPGDDAGYSEFIRSRSRRISRLAEHLAGLENCKDYQSRRLLESLIDERGAALSSPPETVSPELVAGLREEVRSG